MGKRPEDSSQKISKSPKKKNMKRCSNSYHQGNANKTFCAINTMTLIRMVNLKKKMLSICTDEKQITPLLQCQWECKLVQPTLTNYFKVSTKDEQTHNL